VSYLGFVTDTALSYPSL